MTREQYETLTNGDFLAAADKAREDKKNRKNGWGLSAKELLSLANQHKEARATEDYRKMASIEYRLTQINFHDECSMLNFGEYAETELLKKFKKFEDEA